MGKDFQIFNQKVCVVTGAARDGACALALASYGAKTVITDIRKDMLDETTELVKSAGGAVDAHILDVADRDGVYELAAHVEKTDGGADFVLNNAGVAMGASVTNWVLMISIY